MELPAISNSYFELNLIDGGHSRPSISYNQDKSYRRFPSIRQRHLIYDRWRQCSHWKRILLPLVPSRTQQTYLLLLAFESALG